MLCHRHRVILGFCFGGESAWRGALLILCFDFKQMA